MRLRFIVGRVAVVHIGIHDATKIIKCCNKSHRLIRRIRTCPSRLPQRSTFSAERLRRPPVRRGIGGEVAGGAIPDSAFKMCPAVGWAVAGRAALLMAINVGRHAAD